MAKGKSIYFTQKELETLLEVLEEWENKVDEDIYSFRLKRGLGTAWSKLVEAKKEKQQPEIYMEEEQWNQKIK